MYATRPTCSRLRLARDRAEFRIRGDGGLRVAGHFDLGNDGDVPLGGVRDDLADVVLRVEAAVRLAVECSGSGLVRCGPMSVCRARRRLWSAADSA